MMPSVRTPYQYIKLLLEHFWHGFFCAIFLALSPYTGWLSLALIALITLRKGVKEGGVILTATALAHYGVSLASMHSDMAIINTCLTFLPCFIASCLLRYTACWRWVANIFLLQTCMFVLCIKLFAPDVITAQFLYFKAMLNSMHTDNELVSFITSSNGESQSVFANYLLGLQALGIALSALFPLLLARSLQSRLFYPGGFSREMRDFRADKIELILFIGVLIAAVVYNNLMAITLLPLLAVYFFAVGLSLGINMLAGKKSAHLILWLFMPMIILPHIALPAYILCGSLDSLFNFRLYLKKNTNTKI